MSKVEKEALDFNFDSIFTDGVEYQVGNSEEESTPKEDSKEEVKKDVEYIVGEPPEEDEGDEGNEEGTKPEVEEEDTNTPSSENTEENEDASGSFALAFAKFQQDEGVISEFDEEELTKIVKEEGETGALKYLLEKARDNIYEEAKSIYGEDKQELLEYFKLKDAGVDPEIAKELIFQKGEFGNLDESSLEEDEDLRKKVLFQHYKLTTSFTDTKIKKLVENSVSLGEDEEESKEALKELKEINTKQLEQVKLQAKEQEKLRREAVDNYRNDLKKYIYDTTEIIEGQKINKPTQQKIEKMLLEPVKDESGNVTNGLWAERAKDPKKFDTHLAYLLTSGLFYGKMDALKKPIKTKVLNEFEDVLKSKGSGIKGKSTSSKGAQENFSVQEFLKKTQF